MSGHHRPRGVGCLLKKLTVREPFERFLFQLPCEETVWTCSPPCMLSPRPLQFGKPKCDNHQHILECVLYCQECFQTALEQTPAMDLEAQGSSGATLHAREFPRISSVHWNLPATFNGIPEFLRASYPRPPLGTPWNSPSGPGAPASSFLLQGIEMGRGRSGRGGELLGGPFRRMGGGLYRSFKKPPRET
jgi:hypothetical protein